MPTAGSFVGVSPPEFIISAIKEAEDGSGWLVRGYNQTGQDIKAVLQPWYPYKRANLIDLAEEKTGVLHPSKDGIVSFPAKGHGIVTVLFQKYNRLNGG